MKNPTLVLLAVSLTVLDPLFAEDVSTGAATTVEAGSAETATSSVLTAEIAIGTGIENREATGISDTFSADVGQLVGWSRIIGAQQPTEIRHVWKLNGTEVSSVPLNVQSSSFRTYSRKTIAGQTGRWSLDVVDADGRVIASKEFEVTAATPQ